MEPLRFTTPGRPSALGTTRGRSDAWNAERTWYRLSGTMIDRYTRQAETLEDRGYEALPTGPAESSSFVRRPRGPSAAGVSGPASPPTHAVATTVATAPGSGAVAALLRQAASLAAAGHATASADLVLNAQSLLQGS